MTLIATDNGVPIIKDGKVATNCNCCGGIACCRDPSCLYLTHDVRFTVSRDAPGDLATFQGGVYLIAQSPYVGEFVLPYTTYGIETNFLGVTTHQFRVWRLDLPIAEACLQPQMEFRVRWGFAFGSIEFDWRFTYNASHLAGGDPSTCNSAEKTYTQRFSGVCGVNHPDNGYTRFADQKWGRLLIDFVER